MLSKIKLSFIRAVLAGLFFVVLGAQSQAIAAQSPTPAMQIQIQELIREAVSSGDTLALEVAMSELVEANPELAKAIANFASSNVPAGISAEFLETLVVALATSIVSGAPESAGDVTAAIENNQPQFSGAITSGVEVSLLSLDIETAGGGNEPSGGAPGLTTAAGTPARGFLPRTPTIGAGASGTAENRSVNAASPTG